MRHEGKFPVALIDWGYGPSWCEDRRGNWIHGDGPAYHPQSAKDVVLERREVDDDEWCDLLQAADEADHKAELERIRKGVMAQCGGVMIDLVDDDGNVVASVPRAPFVCYALNRTTLAHLMPPWECVAPSGMKLRGDCRYHSDWYYGGGFDDVDGRYPYSSPVHHAAVHTSGLVQNEYGRFNCTVLVSGDAVYGKVGKSIVVLPSLSMDHYEVARRAKAIVTQEGGAMAHMATVLRPEGVVIVRVKDALAKFPKGTTLIVDAENGRVEAVAMDSRFVDDEDE